jgi:putative peptidoglycan lipid II flippase
MRSTSRSECRTCFAACSREGAFSQAFVPVLACDQGRSRGRKSTGLLIDRVSTILSAGVLAVTCIARRGIAAPVLVWAMASGLEQDPRGFEAAVVMSRWMFPYIGFMSLVALGGRHSEHLAERFAIPAATPVFLNLAMIAAIWFAAPFFARHRHRAHLCTRVIGVMGGGVLQLGPANTMAFLRPGPAAARLAMTLEREPCGRPGPIPRTRRIATL